MQPRHATSHYIGEQAVKPLYPFCGSRPFVVLKSTVKERYKWIGQIGNAETVGWGSELLFLVLQRIGKLVLPDGSFFINVGRGFVLACKWMPAEEQQLEQQYSH